MVSMEERKLVRIENNKIIGGVCAGVAQFFGIEVGKIRLIWIILTLLGTAGFWIYLILWIFLPLRNN